MMEARLIQAGFLSKGKNLHMYQLALLGTLSAEVRPSPKNSNVYFSIALLKIEILGNSDRSQVNVYKLYRLNTQISNLYKSTFKLSHTRHKKYFTVIF